MDAQNIPKLITTARINKFSPAWWTPFLKTRGRRDSHFEMFKKKIFGIPIMRTILPLSLLYSVSLRRIYLIIDRMNFYNLLLIETNHSSNSIQLSIVFFLGSNHYCSSGNSYGADFYVVAKLKCHDASHCCSFQIIATR